MDLTPQERDLVIRTMLGEAANQGEVGQAAVANVIRNRQLVGRWGPSATDVVLAPNQFTPWNDRARELMRIPVGSSAYQAAGSLADRVYSGDIPDITGGATHFLNPQTVMQERGRLPPFANGPALRIGAHVFYGGTGVPQGTQKAEDLEKEFDEWRAAPAPGGSTQQPVDLADEFKEWAPQAGVAPSPPPGALTYNPQGSTIGNLGRAVATAGLRAGTDIAGMPGNLQALGHWLAPNYLQAPSANPIAARLGLPAFPPTSAQLQHQIFNTQQEPLAAPTGEYQAQTPGGRTAMSALEGGIAGAVTGGAPVAGAIGGGAGQATAEVGRPELAAAASLLAPNVGALTRKVGSIGASLTPEANRALMQQAVNKWGLNVPVGNIAAPDSLLAKVAPTAGPNVQSQIVSKLTGAIGGDANGKAVSEITPEFVAGVKTRAGGIMGDIQQRTPLVVDPEGSTHGQLSMTQLFDMYGEHPLVDKQIRSFMDTVAEHKGQLPGSVVHDFVKYRSPLDRLADSTHPEVSEPAQQVQNLIQDSALVAMTPEDAAVYQNMRSQYHVASALGTPAARAKLPGGVDMGTVKDAILRKTDGVAPNANAPQPLADAWELASIGTALGQKSQGNLGILYNLLHNPASYAAAGAAGVIGGGMLHDPLKLGALMGTPMMVNAGLKQAFMDQGYRNALLRGRIAPGGTLASAPMAANMLMQGARP